MQKQAPTFGRIFIMAGFALSCFGLLLFLWLAFGGTIPLQPKGYRFHADFPEAAQLAKEADVRISGVPVGKVTDVQLGPGNTTDATIQLMTRYAPIPRDSHAILRQKTLLGETYIELTPGTKGKRMALKENATLSESQIAPTVQLDEIFRAFDQRTRTAFQDWMQNLAISSRGRGQDINDILGNLSPFAQDTNHLVEILNVQRQAVHQLVRNTGTVFSALTARDDQLRSLIQHSNTVFATTARRDQDLKATFMALPTFQTQGRLTINRLTSFAANTNPLVNQLKPAARELSPTLLDLKSLAPDLKGLFIELNPLVDASRRGLPALQGFLRDLQPVLGQLDPFTRGLNPILRFFSLYKPELNTFFSNTVAATQATYNGVHYLRTTNPVNAENLAVYPQRLGSNRPNPYVLPGAFNHLSRNGSIYVYEDRQCPGHANPGPNPQPPTAPPVDIPGLPIPITLPPLPGPIGPPVNGLVNSISKFFFSTVGGAIPAPACVPQGKYPAPYGTDYPRLTADPKR